MEFLKFDIYALAAPKSKEDYSALLDEALLLAGQIHDGLIAMGRALAAAHRTSVQPN